MFQQNNSHNFIFITFTYHVLGNTQPIYLILPYVIPIVANGRSLVWLHRARSQRKPSETRNVFKKDKRRQIKKGRKYNTRLRQAMLPEGFPFHQFNITYYSCCLVPVWRL